MEPYQAIDRFVLNTGRIRDQWHTMTRTGLSPRLGQHLPQPPPFVVIHPIDAEEASIIDGGFARITTNFGNCILKSWCRRRRTKVRFLLPFTGASQVAATARIGALVTPICDPFSGQPE